MRKTEINLYTSIEINSLGLHMTWDFNPGKCEFPEGVEEGQKDTLTVVGRYEDKDCRCLIVSFKDGSLDTQRRQPSGTLLHLTEHVSNGVTPYECGQRATKNGDRITWFISADEYNLVGVWKYTKSN